VKDIAASIYEALKSGSVDLRNAYESDDDEFVEGKLLTETHKRRERNPGLRRKLIAIRNKQGPLICDVCGSKCHVGHPEYQEAPFEAHHLIPLSMAYSTATKLSDLALLCASCHRLVHRAIVLKKRWLTIAECKDIFGC